MKGMPHEVDVFVGKKLRSRRTLVGFSQEDLGKLVGVSFQQIQKYERGQNRIGASRLFEISKVLGVPISYFFDKILSSELRGGVGLAEETAGFEHEKLDNKEILTLVRAYCSIEDIAVRKKILALIKAITTSEENITADIS